MHARYLRTIFLASISGVIPAGAAWAQQQAAQEQGLEVITVTARRVEENLMKVPVAITALTADAIQQRDMKSIIDLAQFTPGMFAYVGTEGYGH